MAISQQHLADEAVSLNTPLAAGARTATFSPGIRDLPGLVALLDAQALIYRPGHPDAGRIDLVLGWGRKDNTRRARDYAQRHDLPYIALEDGFLRSVGLGQKEPPLSLVIDDAGIYYDATGPSRLEALVRAPLPADKIARAAGLIAAWRTGRVSKYNHAREDGGKLPERFVLVADQTRGDAAIGYGLADANSFARMLEAALDEHPDSTVLLKVHPEVFAGRKHGHFDRLSAGQASRVVVLGQDIHPPVLLEQAQAVYTVTSQMGFEALLWGRPARVFGMPFYAGWGLTQDELPAPARRHLVPLENLVHAALIEYPRYIDPETGLRCEAERVLEYLALQRHLRERFPAAVYAKGFSVWKRPIVRAFFAGSQVRFVREARQVPAGETLAVWGSPGQNPVPPECGLRVIRLEDGFLRSAGLGAELVRPLSWVMDRKGIYYDAGSPSELEEILRNTRFDPELLKRAANLRERISAGGVTKYNVGSGRWQPPDRTKPVILVPGQVESDDAIRCGAATLRHNMDLLRAAREGNPDAYIVYKPHPDVVAGLRGAGRAEASALTWCDDIVTDVGMDALLAEVDAVHTLTSLAGFEALLRGKAVTTYGQPFYAGWGLTEDKAPLARRTRRLSLDELVAGALILYPVYLSRTTHRFTTPERALDELLTWRKAGPTERPLLRHVLGFIARMRGK